MTAANTTFRLIDYTRDGAALASFLVPKDVEQLEACRDAIAEAEAFVMIASEGERAIGWAQVLLAWREDLGLDKNGTTYTFVQGVDGYLANIEVREPLRSQGFGAGLLRAAEEETRARGKRRLWLHVRETNVGAHRFYEREGWTFERAVQEPWADWPARIYRRDLQDP